MSCRRAFHAAARRWVRDAIEAGVLTIDHIRKGGQPTCTLPPEAIGPSPASNGAKTKSFIELLWLTTC
jgi:hypothetical protein